MSTFKKEIEQPLLTIQNAVDSSFNKINIKELNALLIECQQIKEKLEPFITRANRSDSPYGEQMKENVSKQSILCENIIRKLEETILHSKLNFNTSPKQVDDVKVDSANRNTIAVADVSLPNHQERSIDVDVPATTKVKGLSTEVIDENFKKIAEAALRIKQRDDRKREEEHIRHLIAAEEEKKRRQAFRQRERQAVREQKEQELRNFQHLITLGIVNHVVGAEDYRNKMIAVGKRACIIDWFAPWCGP
jgi:hypothetical protein